MTNRITTRLSALGLAALVTLATMGGLDMLARQERGELAMASAQTPAAQQVVVVGSRAPRS